MKLEELRKRLQPKKKPEPSKGRHPSGVEYTTTSTTLDGNLTDWDEIKLGDRRWESNHAKWKAEHEAEFKDPEGKARFFVGIDPGVEDPTSVVMTYQGKKLLTMTKIRREKP